MNFSELCAWAAGIVDGEGYIGIYPRKDFDSYHTEVTVANTDKKMVDKLKSLWGGVVFLRKSRGDKYKDIFEWQIKHRGIVPFLKNILPFLVVKKEKALLLLELQTRMSCKNYRRRGIPEIEKGIRRNLYNACKGGR